ncbi:collagen-like protein [Solirubrobacter ginsenosidimutans]|uniref:Collagen-like protein n=1 Tax=Solirubrobacter ginsenosidimutans TaxID=490573 RepID=A0A9X3MYK4_9ACTN|nr:collagen-like protein [Solirubrobacter ginsenosidimutans]MDA0163728.1 collagen-like protein [Solirubrobacter ginsenosidimutans]
MSTLSLRALLAAAAVFLSAGAFLAPAAHAQATRTWVSGVGDDANPCSRTAPCKTFAGSISKTAAGGEINVLDPGGFGAVTITKAITIDASSVEAGILISGSAGVIVNAGVNDNVTLKGLDFNGVNPGTGCPYATTGVRVLQAGSVRIEDSKMERMQKAVEILPTSPVDVFMNHVDISNSCTNGVRVAPAAGGSATVAIQDSTISNSGTALSVADNGKAWLTRSTLFANALGYELLGTGVINDYGDNRLIGNTADGTPTKNLATVVNAAVPGPAGPEGPQGVPGVAGPIGPQGEPALKLLLASSQSSLALKAGKAVTLSYASTAAAKSTLTITKGKKQIATVTGSSKAGANTIKWNGKAGKKAAAAGAYKLTLSAQGTDGQKATTTVSLKLK